MAELATGPEATLDPQERARRIALIQRAEGTFDQLPFDLAAARVYGRIYAAVTAAGRKARGRRAMDLLIAATALSHKLPLYTRNPDDFAGLEDLLDIVVVATPADPDAPDAQPDAPPPDSATPSGSGEARDGSGTAAETRDRRGELGPRA
jgi:predicted nucleic acid-binding protein